MSISAVVVVVSPLISLMHNQVSKLVATFSVNNVAAELKALSDGAEVAGIAKYFLTICISMGNQNPLLFHHWSGFSWAHQNIVSLLHTPSGSVQLSASSSSSLHKSFVGGGFAGAF